MVVNNIPESQQLLRGMEAGARALGWTPIPITYDSASATGVTTAFAEAVRDKPDAVITQAVNATSYSQAAKQLAAMRIPVVTSNTTDPITPPVIANVADANAFKLSGQITANYIIAQEGANADVALFNIPSFPVLTAFESGLKNEYLVLCPSCKFTSVSVQASDIGTNIPAQVVSTVRDHPGINFAVMGFGAVATGVAAALHTAGISDVGIVGPAPALTNISALINGTENMWVAYPLQGVGWKSIDALARYFSKQSTTIDDTAATPYQILTKANVPTPAAGPEVANYQNYFKQLWHVG